jgi:hypothetical protein
VTIDSATQTPWDLTQQCAKYIVKLKEVSAACRISPEEELQLLECNQIVTSDSDENYLDRVHDVYTMTLVKHRRRQTHSFHYWNIP